MAALLMAFIVGWAMSLAFRQEERGRGHSEVRLSNHIPSVEEIKQLLQGWDGSLCS